MSDMEVQEYFDNFFEEVFTELEDRVIRIEFPLSPSSHDKPPLL